MGTYVPNVLWGIFPFVVTFRLGDLTELIGLDLTCCDQLESIPESFMQLTKLDDFKCHGCKALHTPPLAVCEDGAEAVRKYFVDLSTSGIAGALTTIVMKMN